MLPETDGEDWPSALVQIGKISPTSSALMGANDNMVMKIKHIAHMLIMIFI
jgi:hypothetical protein